MAAPPVDPELEPPEPIQRLVGMKKPRARFEREIATVMESAEPTEPATAR